MSARNNFDTEGTIYDPSKTLLGIVVFFLSLWMLSANWLLVKKHPGIIVVLIAVAGEVACDWRDLKGAEGRWKKFLSLLLVGGLLYELYEASDADKQAGEAIERAATAELNTVVASNQVEKLRAKNDELEKQFLPMAIGDRASFARAIVPAQKVNVIISNTPLDEKAHATGFDLVEIMNGAGWKVFNELGDRPIGVRIEYNASQTKDTDPVVTAGKLLHRALADRNIPVAMWPLTNATMPPDTMLIEIGQRPNPYAYDEMVAAAKERDARDDFFRYEAVHHEALTDAEAIETERLFQQYGKSVLRIAQLTFNQDAGIGKSNGVWVDSEKHGDFIARSFVFSNGIPLFVFVAPSNLLIFSNGRPESIMFEMNITDLDLFLHFPLGYALLTPTKFRLVVNPHGDMDKHIVFHWEDHYSVSMTANEMLVTFPSATITAGTSREAPFTGNRTRLPLRPGAVSQAYSFGDGVTLDAVVVSTNANTATVAIGLAYGPFQNYYISH